MRKWIALAALAVAAGCSSPNAATDKQSAPLQTKAEAPAAKRASSISTTNAGSPPVVIQQTPSDNSAGWLDWLFRNNGDAPTGTSGIPSVNPSPSANPSQTAQAVLDLVNQERAKAGLQPLRMNGNLSSMAMVKAQDMYDHHYFDHQSPTYGSPFDMMKARGIAYSTAGENIAQGQTSPAEVMNEWMNSPGHRANILNGSFTQIGIANYNNEWVQEFIG